MMNEDKNYHDKNHSERKYPGTCPWCKQDVKNRGKLK